MISKTCVVIKKRDDCLCPRFTEKVDAHLYSLPARRAILKSSNIYFPIVMQMLSRKACMRFKMTELFTTSALFGVPGKIYGDTSVKEKLVLPSYIFIKWL